MIKFYVKKLMWKDMKKMIQNTITQTVQAIQALTGIEMTEYVGAIFGNGSSNIV